MQSLCVDLRNKGNVHRSVKNENIFKHGFCHCTYIFRVNCTIKTNFLVLFTMCSDRCFSAYVYTQSIQSMYYDLKIQSTAKDSDSDNSAMSSTITSVQTCRG
jgi:hypothetical protein